MASAWPNPCCPRSVDPAGLVASGRRVFEIERQALDAVADRLGEAFQQACQAILASRGRVVATGMGKSGHIARKIAATLASTGTPRSTCIRAKPAIVTWA